VAEGWRIRKDGSRFAASTVLEAIHDQEGALIGFAKITRDITAQRESQELLKRAGEQLLQAGKMEAIGQLTGGVAHDFNNLLTIIIGNLAIAEREVEGLPEGPKLTLETGNTFLDQNYCRANPEVLPGQYVMISVTDNGTGMTKEVIDRAFEPFFSTKSVDAGTGLGLSQVYGFIKQSGGHI